MVGGLGLKGSKIRYEGSWSVALCRGLGRSDKTRGWEFGPQGETLQNLYKDVRSDFYNGEAGTYGPASPHDQWLVARDAEKTADIRLLRPYLDVGPGCPHHPLQHHGTPRHRPQEIHERARVRYASSLHGVRCLANFLLGLLLYS